MADASVPFRELQCMKEAIFETVGVDSELTEYYECRLYSDTAECYETLYFEVEHPSNITVKTCKGYVIYEIKGSTSELKLLQVIQDTKTLGTITSNDITIDQEGRAIMKFTHVRLIHLCSLETRIIRSQNNETLASYEHKSPTQVYVELLMRGLSTTDKVLILSMAFKMAMKERCINQNLRTIARIDYPKPAWDSLSNCRLIELRKIAHLKPNNSDIYKLVNTDCDKDLFVLHYSVTNPDILEVKEIHSQQLLVRVTDIRCCESKSVVLNQDWANVGHFTASQIFNDRDEHVLSIFEKKNQSKTNEKFIVKSPRDLHMTVCKIEIHPRLHRMQIRVRRFIDVKSKAILIGYVMKLSCNISRIRKHAVSKEVDSINEALGSGGQQRETKTTKFNL